LREIVDRITKVFRRSLVPVIHALKVKLLRFVAGGWPEGERRVHGRSLARSKKLPVHRRRCGQQKQTSENEERDPELAGSLPWAGKGGRWFRRDGGWSGRQVPRLILRLEDFRCSEPLGKFVGIRIDAGTARAGNTVDGKPPFHFPTPHGALVALEKRPDGLPGVHSPVGEKRFGRVLVLKRIHIERLLITE